MTAPVTHLSRVRAVHCERAELRRMCERAAAALYEVVLRVRREGPAARADEMQRVHDEAVAVMRRVSGA